MNAPRDTITAREPKGREHGEPTRVGEPAKIVAPAKEGEEHHRLHAPVRNVAVWGPLIAVTVLAALIIMGVWRHVASANAQEQFAQANAQTVVNVQTVHRNVKPINLVLPGTIDA